MRALVVALALVALAGCGGSGAPAGARPVATPAPRPPTYVPPPPAFVPASPLTLEVTNATTAWLDITIRTPSADGTIPDVAPGETIRVTLDELPSYAVVEATPTTTDTSGRWLSFAPIALTLGRDYDAVTAFVGVEWGPTYHGTVAPAARARVVAAALDRR